MRWSCLLGLAACSAPEAGPDAGDDVDANLGVDLPAIPAGCTTERATEDRPDDHGYDQIHVLYVTPMDGRDDAHDTTGRICNSVRAVATWFHAETGSYLRFDTIDGLVDLGFMRLAIGDVAMRGDDPGNGTIDRGIAFVRERIERELPLRANKLYAVYYEGTSSYACGGGAYPPLIVGRVGAMYLRAQPPNVAEPCGDSFPWGRPDLVPSYIDYGMLHELVHSLGIVPDAAPHEHASGHVFDPGTDPQRDLMYSERAGMPDPPWGVLEPGGLVVDIGDDDYASELATSSLIAPLPDAARRPIGW
jgi:hypothetical protein